MIIFKPQIPQRKKNYLAKICTTQLDWWFFCCTTSSLLCSGAPNKVAFVAASVVVCHVCNHIIDRTETWVMIVVVMVLSEVAVLSSNRFCWRWKLEMKLNLDWIQRNMNTISQTRYKFFFYLSSSSSTRFITIRHQIHFNQVLYYLQHGFMVGYVSSSYKV